MINGYDISKPDLVGFTENLKYSKREPASDSVPFVVPP
uniref:Uncharacterized protein n=1 Tax=Fagus sylvatica TaxID=28930 RepID=A0A2N9HKI5_FAGSY